MKKLIILMKVALFATIFGLIFFYVNELVRFKQLALPWNMTTKISGLRYEEPHSIDVMYFGSSHMYCSINPVVLWEQTGIPSYSYATQQQPVWISYYYMKEALKYQTPQVMVLDVFMTKQQEDYSDTSVNRTAIDLLPMSINRLKMIEASVPREERASYILNFIKYHNRWAELKEEDWAWANAKLASLFGLYKETTSISPYATDPLKGYVMLDKWATIDEREDLSGVTTLGELSEKTMLYLEKIIALADEKDIQLVFYKAPSNATVEEKTYFNAVEALAESYGIPFIDYNMLYEEIGLDTAGDFYDKGHVNYVGAEKVTAHFGNFLKTHFALEDKRNHASYQNWAESIAYYENEKVYRGLEQREE